MRPGLVLAVVALASAACSSGAGESDGVDQLLRVDPPITITGALDVSVEEGPVGADDISQINFGSVATDNGVVLVDIPADVVRAAGLSREQLVGGGTFVVRLNGPFEFFDPEFPTYRVGELTIDD